MKKPALGVTDHAVLRYMERVMGLDVEGLRLHLAREFEPHARAGCSAVLRDGHRFVIQDRHLITVVPIASRGRG